MKQEYCISIGMKMIHSLLAMGLLSLSIYIIILYSSSHSYWVFIFPFLLVTVAVLIIVNMIRRKLIIDDHSIICINLFSRKELDFTLIEGCRIDRQVIYIEPFSTNDPKIIINNYIDFRESNKLAEWIGSNFKDLKPMHLVKERQKLLENTNLGLTEVERLKKLKKAKNVALQFNIAAVVLGFVFVFFNNRLSSTVLLSLPLIGASLMIFSNGIIKFLSNPTTSVNPCVIPGIVIPTFLLFIKSTNEYTIVNHNNIWLPALVISGIMFVLFCFAGINKAIGVIWVQVLLMFIVTSLYGFMGTLEINYAFDNSSPEIYNATVLSHHIRHRKSTTHYLMLSPWGPVQQAQEIDVRKSLYNTTSIGDTVSINLKTGVFHIPWFVITKKQPIETIQ